MNPRIVIFAILITLSLLNVSQPVLTQSIPDIVSRTRPSVVLVFSQLPDNRLATGSGFVVHPSGLILTAYHILENHGRMGVLVRGTQQPLAADLVAFDRDLDVAILRVPRQNLPSLALGDSSVLRQGEDILVIGYPRTDALGFVEPSVTRGIVSNLTTRFGWIQIDAALNPGNSGGPVLNLRGEVVGIAVAGLREAVGINFAVPINRVKQFVSAHLGPAAGPTPPPQAGPPSATPPSAPSSPQPPSPQPPERGLGSTTIVLGASVGPIRIGMKVSEVAELLGLETREAFIFVFDGVTGVKRGLKQYRWYLTSFVSEYFDPMIQVVIDEGESIIAIHVQADLRFKTRDGIGVGSQEAEIRQILGQPARVSEVSGAFAHRRLFYDSLGIRFTIMLNNYYTWEKYHGTAFDVAVYPPQR